MDEKKPLGVMLGTTGFYGAYIIDEGKIEKFRKLVVTCKEHSIDLKVFICPVKAMYWEFYYENGLWLHVEELKRQFCSIYPIWDFSGFNLITTEMLDTDKIPLYYECSHFTPFLGKQLLMRMVGQPSQIDSIGYLLKPENIETVL